MNVAIVRGGDGIHHPVPGTANAKAGPGDNKGPRQRTRRPAGQGQSVITICNYDKYDGPDQVPRGKDEGNHRTTAGQRKGREKIKKVRR
jgi:hypothetical protein